jgi:hypothetical protein
MRWGPPPEAHHCPPRLPSQILLALKRANLDRKIGRSNVHVNLADAVAQATLLVQERQKTEGIDTV